MFVKPDRTYDFQKLKEVTKVATRNLNKIIDVNFYPVPEVRYYFKGENMSYCFQIRLSDPTRGIVQLALVFKVWPTPSF